MRWVLFVPLWHSLFRPDVRAREFFLHVCAPPLVSLVLLGTLASGHDAIAHAPGWIPFMLEGFAVLAVVSAVQLAVGEALPGGRERRRDVARSFRPVAIRAWELLRGREPR